ncbi:MAG: hypothetical protein L6R38_006538, partial [Xanthoria sp. 2 TBL-2021]
MQEAKTSASAMAAAPAETYWVSTALLRNIHCTSCISHIQEVLSNFGPQISCSSVSILNQSVEVRHQTTLPIRELCAALDEEAFDVVFATTKDEFGSLVDSLDYSEHHAGWMETALGRCCSPETAQARERSYSTRPELDRKARHTSFCKTCRNAEADEMALEVLGESSIKYHEKSIEDDEYSVRATVGSIATVPEGYPRRIEEPVTATADTQPQHGLTVMISGMTCASCTNSITAAVQELDFVSKVEVSLLTHSAKVEYTGGRDMAGEIIDLIEDVGFEASIGEVKPLAAEITKVTSTSRSPTAQRSVQLSIDGMFCQHCPGRLVNSLTTKYPSHLIIEDVPSIEKPIIRLIYTPSPGLLTIRDIVSTIDAVHEKFNTQVYHPPSIEDQSRLMQAQERKILTRRLVLCFFTSIPTLLIGVVWMSLVSTTNSARKYFETAVWSGTVTRAQWALCILATPIMFCAASVFHVHAMKEIRALWRPKSQVPILRRFYRFGSMNLLVSAGTSVAYFSSIALLIQGARTKQTTTAMSGKPQYFDAVVFLTTFILLGKFIEAYSKAKTGSAVTMLGQLRPQEAILVLPTTSRDKDQSRSSSQETQAVSASRTQTISVDLLEIGDVVVVPSGSSPPADSIIVSGVSRFNESSLTGEARDVPKNEGDQVFAGTVNTGNPVQVEITGLGGTSMLDQIISVVREGQTKRAPVERVVDTVTAYFVPVITALAITTFLVWFALGQSGSLDSKYIKNQDGGWAFWSLEFAIAVFVVACPCGIGLAAPTALFVGGGLAAKSGILVRGGGEAFQEASNLDAVVFDKTGTLTEGGNPTVTDHEMLAEGNHSKIAWSVTRCLEETSSHPLARAILLLASTQTGAEVTASSITEEAGRGLRGTFTINVSREDSNSSTSYEAAIGSEDFIASLQEGMVNYYSSTTLSTWKSQSKSVALLALRQITDPFAASCYEASLSAASSAAALSSTALSSDDSSWGLAAMFAISDPLRPSAIPTINALQSRGIAVYMLTGDNRSTASAVASTLSIPADHVFAGCLPTQKAEKIKWLKENAPLRQAPSRSFVSKAIYGAMNMRRVAPDSKKPKRKAVVAFIGDGINDAPALASANVSIAISSHNGSSDIALSTSSFILLSSSLTTILVLLNLSRLVFRRIKYNFAWAVAYNAVLIPVAAGLFFRVKEGG